jgi:RNA polymerase sigma factor (sigma-70 family)
MSAFCEGPGERLERAPERRASRAGGGDWIQAHRRRIFWIAREYRHFGVPMEDLIAEGTVGLLEAAARFDPARGVKFASYAVWWIRKRVCEVALSQAGLIRIPRYRLRHLAQLRAAEREFTADFGRPPSSEEVSRRSGLPEEEVRLLLGLSKREVPLGAPAGEDSGLSIEETLADRRSDGPDDTLLREDRLALLARTFVRLPPREVEVLSLRFGLDGRAARTLAEVGEHLALSRERVRQLESRAIKRLRSLLAEEGRSSGSIPGYRLTSSL